MIIAGENIEQHWIDLLRSEGYPVLSVREVSPGISDMDVVAIAKSNSGILITEDKDFGELVFAHGINGLSVVFLRYDQPRYEQIQQSVLDVIAGYHHREGHFFITISASLVRIRTI